MPVVYSTLTAPQAYSVWVQGGGDLPAQKLICVIKGGAGIANKNLITPRGVATHVTPSELEGLNQCPMFQRHKERGYIRVDDKELDAEKVASDMASRDNSAPLTDGDFEADGKPAPKSGKNKPKQRG
jgi:hypothetical protein